MAIRINAQHVGLPVTSVDIPQVDIPLSVSMYRWVVNEQRWLTLSDVRHVAPELWRSLCRLRRVAERARLLAADARHSPEQRTQMVSIQHCT